MFYAGVSVGFAHYGETDTGPNPGSFALDGPAFAVPVLMAGVQVTSWLALGAGAAFHPFYAVGGSFAAGGFGGLALAFSPVRTFDLDVIAGGGGIGVAQVFGGSGPAGSPQEYASPCLRAAPARRVGKAVREPAVLVGTGGGPAVQMSTAGSRSPPDAARSRS
jgi:hypothetical protein